MSQMQQERLDQQENTPDAQEPQISEQSQISEDTQTSGESQPTGEVPQKKRKKSKGKWVSIEDISPKPSYWPLALTVSISLLLMGIIIHPIVIGVGGLLVIVSIIGWMLERR